MPFVVKTRTTSQTQVERRGLSWASVRRERPAYPGVESRVRIPSFLAISSNDKTENRLWRCLLSNAVVLSA